VFRRQAGSHMMLRRDQPYARVVVPDHKQVRLGTLRRIVADAGLTVEQFVELLRR
jgi:predicted RNA binding protein YcfA (HicA-like mRNA interferase family)